MSYLRALAAGLLGCSGLIVIHGCGEQAAGSSSTTSSGAGGAATTTAGAGGSGQSGGPTGSTTTSAAGGGGGGAPPACPLPMTKPPELSEPDPRRPWAGAVTIIPSTAAQGVPVASWRVDSAAMLTPTPAAPYSILDTRKLPDGLHTLSIDVVDDGGAIHTADTTFCVANGAPPNPSFQGKFVDVTEVAGLPKGPGPMMAGALFFYGAVAGDLDGDGDDDLFVWTEDSAQVYEQVAPWSFMPKGAPIPGMRTAAMADLDGDGDLDIAAAGQGFRLLENQGGALVDVTAQSGVSAAGPAWNGFRGVVVADLDQDGLLDVLATQMTCSGGSNLVLRNEGGLHFVDVAPELSLQDPEGATWGIAADLLEDGSTMRIVRYYEAWCKPGPTDYFHFLPGPDLPVMGNFQQKKLKGVSPMGDAWIDADGDGLLDQWLGAHTTNPLWGAPSFLTNQAAYVGLDTFVDGDSVPYASWAMVVLDADLDGKADVFVAHDPIVIDPKETIEGSRDGLYWQRAPGEFRDVAEAAGLVGAQPCRGAFGADLDRDGDTDLIVGCRGSLRVLRNDLVDPAAGRTLILHGKVSNADGVHAIVTAPGGEKRMMSGSGQPFAGGLERQSVRAPSGEISVRWPSGIVQKVDAGSGPVLHITEPAAVSIAKRRVAVGSGEGVGVTVDPGALGTPDAAVSVTMNGGFWGKPLGKDADGIWRGTWMAPPQVSTVTFTVTIGATVLGVQPRIYVR